MISITADRIKAAGLICTTFISAAKGITVYGNRLLALCAVGYYTLWQAIRYSYKTMDYYSLATLFGQLVISFVPGTTWLTIALNVPRIIGAW